MPAIVTATIVRWAVDRTGQTPIVNFVSATPFSMYVADGTNSSDFSPVIAQFILDTAQNNPQDQADLLAASRDGLLQVTGYQRTAIASPAVPPPRGAQPQPAAVPQPQPAAVLQPQPAAVPQQHP
jgi:hypothetical protein